MNESATSSASSTDDNCYNLAVKLRELKLKEAGLRHKLATAKSDRQLQRIQALNASRKQAVHQISNACFAFTENANQLETIIDKDEDYVPLAREKHRLFKQLLGSSLKVLDLEQTNKSDNNNINVNLATSLENVKNATVNADQIDRSLDCNVRLYTNVNNAMSRDKKNSLQIEDAHKPRTRRSVLSESTFLNTFEANNISTSSQYEEIIKSRPHNSK